jgi:cytochrome c-type biogenesis protein
MPQTSAAFSDSRKNRWRMVHDVSIPTFVAGIISFYRLAYYRFCRPIGSTSRVRRLSDEAALASKRVVVMSAVMFVLCFATVFVALGASASLIGGLIRAWSAQLSIAASIVTIVMGLRFLGLTRIAFLMREGWLTALKPVGLGSAYVMGLAFAFAWTPCIGPILAIIVSNCRRRSDGNERCGPVGGVHDRPVLIVAGPAQGSSGHGRVRHGLMGLTGMGFLTGSMSTFSIWLMETFPAWANFRLMLRNKSVVGNETRASTKI